MALTVKFGYNAPDGFLDSVYALEKIVYPSSLWGKRENLQARFDKNNDSFILVYDEDILAGYINFFPVCQKIDEDYLNYESCKMWDDDISADDITDWNDNNNVFVISVVTHPDYRDGEAIKLISRNFAEFICKKETEGKIINSISGAAVSDGGVNFLSRFRAEFYKELDHGYKYYRTDRLNVTELIKNTLYKKSYKDDLYFYIPMSSKMVSGTYNEIKKKSYEAVEKFCTDENHFGKIYVDAINEHIAYECNSHTLGLKGLEHFYLGEYKLACYNDHYVNLEEKAVTTETCHIFISVHNKTGLHIITVAIPDNEYLPTQLIDQMSADHLNILDENTGKFVVIKDYFGSMFNLKICGDTKFVMCLSNMPENPTELGYALAGETYNSEHIDYHILPNHINELISANHSSYDYYHSYISHSGIAFILNDFSNDIVKRVEKYEASVLFVVEFVLLQNTALLRTNRHVIRALEESDKITNEDIEKLYIEFGKTMKFWNSDIYKYPYTQREADQVIEAFGINKTMEEYHRNQQYLDRLIELKSKMDEKDSNDTTNGILYVLSAVEGSAVTLGALLWLFKNILDKSTELYGLIEQITRIAWPILFVFVLLLFSSKWFIKLKKKIAKKNKRK